MKNAAKWAVVLTGVYDLLLGLALIAGVRPSDPAQQATWALMLAMGGFLLFAGAVLVWAAQDLSARGPAVFWQGLLRLWAAGVAFAGIEAHFYPAGDVDFVRTVAIIDVVAAVIYAIVLFGVWKHSPLSLLRGRSSPTSPLSTAG